MTQQSPLALEKKPLFMLIDGHALVHRAYHAITGSIPLTTRVGVPTTAVFGFTNILLKALEDVKPTHWAIAFDLDKPTFRHLQYQDYKAGRAETPDDLRVQFKRVRELVEAFGIPIIEREGYEADDVLGALSFKASQQGAESIILTGDQDAMQLVGPLVRIRYQSGKGETSMYDEQAVRERYGVEAKQITDFKGLKGDPSDNIPGVPGIGDKTAAKLLQQFGSVEDLYRRIDEVEPAKLRENLKQHEAAARQSKYLATIKTDLDVPVGLEQFKVGSYDRERVVALFRELEFTRMLDRLPRMDGATLTVGKQASLLEPEPAAATAAKGDYRVVDTTEELEALATELRQAGRFAFDTETTGLNTLDAQLVGLSFSTAPETARYVPVGHRAGRQLSLDQALSVLKPILEDPAVQKLAHNAKYDMSVLATHGVTVRGVTEDTMLAAALVGEKSASLKPLAFAKLGIEMTPITALIGTGKKQRSMAEVDIPSATAYAAADADMTLRLWPILEKTLKEQECLPLFYNIEMPLVPVLMAMERRGITLDVKRLQQMSVDLQAKLGDLERRIYDSVGHRFNINSPQQLSDVLFKEIGLPKSKRTQSGYSTDAAVLETLKGVHPVIELMLEYREISKLRSTYVEALPTLVNPATGRLHTTYNQIGAATGRLSSNDPNLQNIPVRTELGRQVRSAFVAGEPGWQLLSADYSQIELRILAHMTEDPALVEAFRNDEDIHASTASKVFNVPLGEVTPDQRRFAKVVNFGILYGMGEFGLASRAEMSREEAAPIIASYFEKYKGIQTYLDDTKRQALEKGYVQTLFGRRRSTPELQSGNRNIRMAGERMAVNMPIQGTAADLMKIAMINVHRAIEERQLQARMLLQVHDELIFEAPENEMDALKDLARDVMSRAMEMKIPLKVDVKMGRTWGDME